MERLLTCNYYILYILIVATVSSITHAIVPLPPKIIRQPPPDVLPFQVAHFTDDKVKPIILDCEANGVPEIKYMWTKNEQPFYWQNYKNRISQQPGRGTLVITEPRVEDEGYYRCFATNELGTAVTSGTFLRQMAKPYWISEPSDKIASEDEDVVFECKASGVPEPEVKWFMNGVALNEAKPNPRRKVLSPTSILIEKLEKTDTAVYQCNVSNIHGYVFKNFYVNVLAIAPQITTSPEPKYEVIDRRTIRLSCEVFGSPKPVVKWTRNNQELRGNRFTILENGDLEIRNALFPDAGHYQCIARNKFGEKKSNENLGLLEVKEQTRIIVKPEDYEVPAGQSATFRCEAAADPDLDCKIIWLKDDQIIDFDQDARLFKATDNSLSISKTKELDSGMYTCVASTRLGIVTAKAMLVVQDVPNKPSMVGVECDNLLAKVKWQPMGDSRAPILSYKIQYNTSFTPDSWEDDFSSVPASDFKFEVAMSPWATYTFRVIARNKIGESPPSAHSDSCQTPPDVPYKNPENVVGKGTTPTNLVISWTPMPPIEHNAEGFFYRIYYRLNIPDNAWMPPIDINEWKTSQYEVKDQETFKEYLIKVEAHNSMGQANVAAMEVTGYSGEDVPALAPANLTLVRVFSGNSAEFGWEPVSQSSVNGHFKGYKIQTWLPGENPNQGREMIVASNIIRTTVEMLVPFADNSVQVLVFNGRFNGPPSKAVTFKTPEGVPGPVQSFEAVAMGGNALYLMWKKPLEENGILTGYKLNWEKVKGTKLSKVQGPKIIQNPGETRTKLGSLEPGTKYRVTIRAMTSVGDGVPYFIENSTHATGAAAPDKPTFTWMFLPTEDNKTGVRVTWLPNVDGNPGSQFFVQYRRKDDAQFTKTSHETNGDSIEIRDLDSGTVYEMGVVAVDGVYMIPSDIEEIETIGAVPGPVQSFEAVAMGANALYFMWKKPLEENGKLTGYKLNWEKVKGTKLSEVQGPKIIQIPGETRTKLGNLEPGTKYRVTITAMTSVGDGVPYFIEDSTHATGAAAPDKPTFTWMLLPTEDNKAGVRVTWLPNVDGHPGSQFFVQYRRKDDAEFTRTSHETNGDSIEIRDLDSGTVYEMRVVAVDGVYMIPSDIEEIETIGTDKYLL